MSGKHTAGPWYVVDLRASVLREQGWEGPSIDRILITDTPRAELTEIGGADCVVARVQFDQRSEELGENNLADARLIAAAPELFAALKLVRSIRMLDNLTAEQFASIDSALRKASGEG